MTTAGDASMMKLGKLAPRHDVRTLMLSSYLPHRRSLPTPPPILDWNQHLPAELGMMLNDQEGDCGLAAQAHAVQTWTGNNGAMVTILDVDVQAAYSKLSGYVPGDASTDTGVVMLDALNQWRHDGIGGHKIAGFVKVDHHNLLHVRTAVLLFGGVYVGAQLPLSAQDISKPWHGLHRHLYNGYVPGSWGGHAMWAARATTIGGRFVTWGKNQDFDWQWWLNYVDECYAPFSYDWLNAARVAPNGLDVLALEDDLAAL